MKPTHLNHLLKMVEKFEQNVATKWAIEKHTKISPIH